MGICRMDRMVSDVTNPRALACGKTIHHMVSGGRHMVGVIEADGLTSHPTGSPMVRHHGPTHQTPHATTPSSSATSRGRCPPLLRPYPGTARPTTVGCVVRTRLTFRLPCLHSQRPACYDAPN